MKLRTLLLASVVISVASIPMVANAWGTDGHQIIAAVAERQLSPQARAATNRLLALEPGETLVTISTWADEHRNPATAPWHYVNLPKGDCNYDQERNCPDGRCVVEAINREVAVLKSDLPDAKKLNALKYLVHFVGDVHQPLHAGYAEDRGGNSYQLQAFMRGSNLHALWDSGIIRQMDEGHGTIVHRLAPKFRTEATVTWSASQAAQESCKIVGTAGFYPDRKVGMDYIETFKPTLENRLGTAGARLAQVLNGIWR